MEETIRPAELAAAKRRQPPNGQAQRQTDSRDESSAKPAATTSNKNKKSHQLPPGQSFRKGIRQVVRRDLDKALEQVQRFGSVGEPPDVHDIRKRFKRVRAILRLVRSEMGDCDYRRANTAIRGAGLVLSDVRNAKVVLQSLTALRDKSSDAPREVLDVVGQFLRARQWDVRDQLAQNQRAHDALREAIEETRKRVKTWSLPRGAGRPVRRGLKRAYNQARRAFEAAQVTPTDEHLHECRKRAKYFYLQLDVVQALGPASNKVLEEGFHELEKSLGEDHDLAMLRREATACQNGGLIEKAGPLIGLIDDCRRDVQRLAMERARQFFGPKGNAVRKRISAWPKKSAAGT